MKFLVKNVFFIILSLTFFALFSLNIPKTSVPFSPTNIEYYYKDGSYGKVKSVDKKFLGPSFYKKGEAYTLDGVMSISDALQFYDAEIVFIEDSEWGVSVYAYSKKVKYEKVLNDKRINVHIHVSEERGQTKIGFPMIYGSF